MNVVCTVLIDDEAAQVAKLQKILAQADYEFRTAASAAEARALLENDAGQPQAILLDWVLPDMDGIGRAGA